MSRKVLHSIEEWETERAEIIDAKVALWKGEKDAVEFYEIADRQMEEFYVLVRPQAKPKAPALTTPSGGARGRSSYQKVRDDMPPTARRVDDLADRLTGFNPRGEGLFNLGKRDAAKRLGCSETTALTYIQLHVEAGWWVLVERGSKRERKTALYRRALPSEIDFEAASRAYRGYRQRMQTRSKTLRDADLTLTASV